MLNPLSHQISDPFIPMVVIFCANLFQCCTPRTTQGQPDFIVPGDDGSLSKDFLQDGKRILKEFASSLTGKFEW